MVLSAPDAIAQTLAHRNKSDIAKPDLVALPGRNEHKHLVRQTCLDGRNALGVRQSLDGVFESPAQQMELSGQYRRTQASHRSHFQNRTNKRDPPSRRAAHRSGDR